MDVIEEVAPPVNRPLGVSASAVVVIIGSVLALVVAAIIATIPAPPPGAEAAPPLSQSQFRVFSMGLSIFLAALGALGIWTAVGLFRLRPWARMSILVFAGIMTAICAISIVAVAMIPFPVPKGQTPNDVRMLKPFMLAMYSIPTLIGAWWLIQFTRPATKAAFASNGPVVEPERPLSISIIGWMFVIGGPACIIPIFARMPLFVAGTVFTGVQAQLGYFIYGALSAYLGWGLLKLQERVRKLSIAYFAVTAVHGVLVSTVPSWRATMAVLEKTIVPPSGELSPMGNPQMFVFTLLFAFLFCGGGIWFLIKNKNAFNATELRD